MKHITVGLFTKFHPKSHGLFLLEKGLELFTLFGFQFYQKRIGIVILFVVGVGFVRKNTTL